MFVGQDKSEEGEAIPEVVEDETYQEEQRRNALREVMLRRVKEQEEEGTATDKFKVTLPESCNLE